MNCLMRSAPQVGLAEAERFHMPLTQKYFADTMRPTPIHVNRTR